MERSSIAGVRAHAPEPEHRRTFARVRRDSRPRGEGRHTPLSRQGADQLCYAIRLWERRQAKGPKRKIRAVGHIAVEVFRFLAQRTAKGRLDNVSYAGLGKVLGYARSAIVAAVARLKAFGWLDWWRQWVPTGRDGRRGELVEQTCNFFWITAPLAQLTKLGIRLGHAPPPDDHDHAARAGAAANAALDLADSRLGRALEALGAAVGGTMKPPTGRIP